MSRKLTIQRLIDRRVMSHICVFIFALGATVHRSFASEPSTSTESKTPSAPSAFSFELPRQPERPRNTTLPPLVSLFFPGFDQWFEGQHKAALLYSGTALGGLLLANSAGPGVVSDLSSSERSDLDSRRNDVRTSILGNQLYLSAGSFSAYASFRSAVRSHWSLDPATNSPLPGTAFSFLDPKAEETTDQLLLAPFNFQYLCRPTTIAPLALLTVLAAIDLTQDTSPFRNNSYNSSDFAFGSAFSYLAGTNEEALFRGYVLPNLMESWQSRFWSNSVTALAFGAAHLGSDNPFPLPQFALGWYLGYLVQQDQWRLGEAIFIHTWWDVLAFAAIYLDESRDQKREAWLTLPLVNMTY